MTVNEMDKAIENFCQSRRNCTVNGNKCPLWDYKCGEKSESEIEKNYKLLVESGFIATEEEKEETPTKTDNVNHPSHYTHGMECIDEMILIFGLEATAHYCLLAAWKYRKRSPFKDNPIQDMDKSDWYIKKYAELKEVYECQQTKSLTKHM